MSFRLYSSNQLESLSIDLVARFNKRRIGVFQPDYVVTQTEGMGKSGYALMVIGGFDMEQEGLRMGLETRIRTAWRFAAQHTPHFTGANASGDAGKGVIGNRYQ